MTNIEIFEAAVKAKGMTKVKLVITKFTGKFVGDLTPDNEIETLMNSNADLVRWLKKMSN